MNQGCRKCRRQGVKLFLKGEKCSSSKCPLTSRPYAPGQHGPNKFTKVSEYGKQLLEKQKVRNIYGISETQLKNYYLKASKAAGNTGENLVRLLESRLDSVVYNLGFFSSRSQARQAVSHDFFTLNAHKSNIPSILVKAGDTLAIKNDKILKSGSKIKLPTWVEASKDKRQYTIKNLPSFDNSQLPYDTNLVIEYYSR